MTISLIVIVMGALLWLRSVRDFNMHGAVTGMFLASGGALAFIIVGLDKLIWVWL